MDNLSQWKDSWIVFVNEMKVTAAKILPSPRPHLDALNVYKLNEIYMHWSIFEYTNELMFTLQSVYLFLLNILGYYYYIYFSRVFPQETS